MRSARPLASQYPVLKVRAAGRFGAARQGDILPYPGRRGGVFPALHGSYTYGGRPPGHAHGGQSHREPGVGAQWESARMGTGARAPRAIGTEHAGHEGRGRAPGGRRPRARGYGTVGRPRQRGMMRRHGADSKRSAETCSKDKKEAGPRRAPLCTYMEVPSTGQRRPALPRASPAVPSALGGLASGFGMGPGVPRPPWPLTGGRRSAHFNFALTFIHAVSIPMQEMFTNSISASNDKQKPFNTSKCMGRYRAF